MRKYGLTLVMMLMIALMVAPTACGQSTDWTGEWVTDKGLLVLEQSNSNVSGRLGKEGDFSGTVEGDRLSFTFKLGRESGKGTLTIESDGSSCDGTYDSNIQEGTWRGWKRHDDATKQSDVDFSGVWLSSLGTLMLEQDDDLVKGTIGAEGWSFVKSGEVEGTQLTFKWAIRNFSGDGWFQQTADGKRIFGVMNPEKDPTVWVGIRPEDYEMDAKPIAGEVVKGIAKNGMLYNLRMPDGWKEGDTTDVIVLLHGSNWTTSGMVYVTAKNWPEIGKKFAILGIQGQNWAKWSNADDLRFNYTYVNWVGRSTLGGFPYTDRESPFLVANVVDDFKDQVSVDRVFVGGHSQGGYLTYVLALHYPEKFAGTFPMAGGMIIQAEPDVFDDEDLIQDQHNTPMYILHGKKDNVVSFTMGQYAYRRLLAHDFHTVKLSTPSRGHPYDFLPVDKAIHWLDMMSTNDKEALAKFGQQQVDSKKWRDVGMVIERAKEIDGGKAFSAIWRSYEEAASKDAGKFLRQIEANKNNKWIDKFLEWKEQFGLTSKCKSTLEAFESLQAEHDEPANELRKLARKSFQSNQRDEGYAKYQEIVDKYYASKHYPTTKATLEDRK